MDANDIIVLLLGMVAVLNLMDDGYPSRTSYEMLHKMLITQFR